MIDNDATKAYNREDRDLLIRIDTKLGNLLEQFHTHKDSTIKELTSLSEGKLNRKEANAMKIDADKIHDDYELRLRRIEKYGSIAMGAIMAVQAYLGIKII